MRYNRYNGLKFLGHLWLAAGVAGIVTAELQKDFDFSYWWSMFLLLAGAFALAWEKE